MLWRVVWRRHGPVEPLPLEPQPRGGDDLRLFPIVGRDALLPGRRGLVPDRAWVASTPLYG